MKALLFTLIAIAASNAHANCAARGQFNQSEVAPQAKAQKTAATVFAENVAKPAAKPQQTSSSSH